LIHSAIIASAKIIVFLVNLRTGVDYRAGVALGLAYVLGGYDDPASRWQAMNALSLNFAALLFITWAFPGWA